MGAPSPASQVLPDVRSWLILHLPYGERQLTKPKRTRAQLKSGAKVEKKCEACKKAAPQISLIMEFSQSLVKS